MEFAVASLPSRNKGRDYTGLRRRGETGAVAGGDSTTTAMAMAMAAQPAPLAAIAHRA